MRLVALFTVQYFTVSVPGCRLPVLSPQTSVLWQLALDLPHPSHLHRPKPDQTRPDPSCLRILRASASICIRICICVNALVVGLLFRCFSPLPHPALSARAAYVRCVLVVGCWFLFLLLLLWRRPEHRHIWWCRMCGWWGYQFMGYF